MDFITDSIVTGRRFRVLTIVDDYTRECPAIEVDTSLGGRSSMVGRGHLAYDILYRLHLITVII
jgi:hypothetical protein